MPDMMGKGSGEEFYINVNVNFSQAKTALSNISQTLDEITKKIGAVTSQIVDLQARIASLYSQPLNTQLMLNINFASANVDEASLDAAVQNIVSRIKARLQLAGEANQFTLPVTFTTKGGKEATSVDALIAMTSAMTQAVNSLTKSIESTTDTVNKLEDGLSRVTKKASEIKRISGSQGGLLDRLFLSRGVTYSTVYQTLFGQLGYLVWAVRNVSLTASNIGRTVKSMAIDTVGVQQNFMLTLTSITGSAEKAKELRDTIWDISRRVGVDMASLMHTAQQAAVYNIPYERIQQMLQTVPIFAQMVGAVSGGGAAGASAITSRAIMAIGQMYAKGKVVAEEKRQLANIGINIVELIAQGMGKAPAEVEDMMRKGLLTDVDAAVGMILDELGKKTQTIAQYIGGTTTGALAVATQSLQQIWATVAGTISTYMMPVLTRVSTAVKNIAESVSQTGNIFIAIRNNVSSWLYNMLTTTYAWLANLYNVITAIFQTVINILFNSSSILRPILLTVISVTMVSWLLASILKLLGPAVSFVKAIWALSTLIATNFSKWVAWIKATATGLVGVITRTTTLSALLSGIMTKAAITSTMLTLGISLALGALAAYVVNVIDRTINRKMNDAMEKMEDATQDLTKIDTKNLFTKPVKDTDTLKDNVTDVADQTERIRNNLQSFDVIHAIEQQVEALANVTDLTGTTLDVDMPDYTDQVDNLMKEIENVTNSIQKAAVPKLDDINVNLKDIWETVSGDISGLFDGMGKVFDTVLKGLTDAFKFLTGSLTNLWNDIRFMLGIGEEIGPTRLMTEQEASWDRQLQLTKNAILPLVQVAPTFSPAPSSYQPGIAEPKIVLEINERKYEYPDFLTREYYINGNRVKPRP